MVVIFTAVCWIIDSYAMTATIDVTEKIPWSDCVETADGVTCTVDGSFDMIMNILQAMINWLAFIAMLWWVLYIIINGILYMAWDDKEAIKKRIIKTLTWLILLLLSWVVLHLIAPWVYTG